MPAPSPAPAPMQPCSSTPCWARRRRQSRRPTCAGCAWPSWRITGPGQSWRQPVQQAFDGACQDLARAGAVLSEVTIPDLDLAGGAMFPVLGPEASAIHSRWLKERPADYAPLTRLQLELGFAVPALAHVRAQQYRRYLTGQLLGLLARGRRHPLADGALGRAPRRSGGHRRGRRSGRAAHRALQSHRAAGADGELRLWPGRAADRPADRGAPGQTGWSWPSAPPSKRCGRT